ncbi:MAG: YtxH domain-containing protein [Ginsengibacter sp.]
MNKSNTIAGIILGAAAGVALIRFFNMPKEKRDFFFAHLRNTTHSLLDEAEETVEKVEHYMDEIKSKGEEEFIDKLYILKRMFKDLYGSEQHFLL